MKKYFKLADLVFTIDEDKMEVSLGDKLVNADYELITDVFNKENVIKKYLGPRDGLNSTQNEKYLAYNPATNTLGLFVPVKNYEDYFLCSYRDIIKLKHLRGSVFLIAEDVENLELKDLKPLECSYYVLLRDAFIKIDDHNKFISINGIDTYSNSTSIKIFKNVVNKSKEDALEYLKTIEGMKSVIENEDSKSLDIIFTYEQPCRESYVSLLTPQMVYMFRYHRVDKVKRDMYTLRGREVRILKEDIINLKTDTLIKVTDEEVIINGKRANEQVERGIRLLLK